MKLNEKADNFAQKAADALEQGKDAKAARLQARADALYDKAHVFEDLNEVLKCAIDYTGESEIDESVNPEDDSEDDSMFS